MSSFHYEFILSKRSSLAKVWLAAHWEKKLSKVQVYETNLQSSVQDILNPRTPIALRTSSHLLVGLVRIYSRKAKYLLTDCSETLVNIKVSFRPGVASLSTSTHKKRKSAQDMLDCPIFITEKVDLLDQWVPEVSNNEMDCSLNQSKVEEITLQEEPIKVNTSEDYFEDEGFGDMFESDFSYPGLKGNDCVFSWVYSFTDSGCGTEDGFLLGDTSFNDFSDPFFALTPVKEDNENNAETAMEDNIQTPLILPTEETYTELKTAPIKHLFLEPTLRIQLDDFQNTECAAFTLDPIEERIAMRKKRPALKRKLVIDQEISISREAFFTQLNASHTSSLMDHPMFAPTTKRRMEESTHDKLQSLFSINLPKSLAPCLQDILKSPRCRKSSTPSTPRERQDITVMDTAEDGEFSSIFIPLRDVDYSSDEDDMTLYAHDSIGAYLGSADSFPVSPFAFPDSTDHFSDPTGLRQVEPCPLVTNDDPATDFDQEGDMSDDRFCAYVENCVAKASPNPVAFSCLVSNGMMLTRKIVARRFLKCLLMQRDARIHIEQSSHFSEINLNAGPPPLQNVQLGL